MSNDLETFNEILHLQLRPWKIKFSTQKFQKLLNELKKESYQYQPYYDVAFIKPVNEKRKFYHALITNEAIRFLNDLHCQFETALNEKEKIFWVTSTIDKKLKPKFSEIKNIIEKKDYQLSNINLTNDDAYIVQFLKHQLIRLYLEVQESYPNHLNDEPLTDTDIHSNFFSDAPFEKQVIISEERTLVPRKVSSTPKAAPSKFIHHDHEIREPKEGILTYEEIINKPGKFGSVESILFDDTYIDKDLKFIRKKGNKLIIAAIAQVLFHNNYFKAITLHNNKKVKVTDRHVHQFISHRYMTNISQEFRRFRDPKVLEDFLKDKNWIKLLRSS